MSSAMAASFMSFIVVSCNRKLYKSTRLQLRPQQLQKERSKFTNIASQYSKPQVNFNLDTTPNYCQARPQQFEFYIINILILFQIPPSLSRISFFFIRHCNKRQHVSSSTIYVSHNHRQICTQLLAPFIPFLTYATQNGQMPKCTLHSPFEVRGRQHF